MIRLENIHKHYFNNSGTVKQEVLKDISIEISAGDSIAILGPSGCGKSTMLNLIGCIDKANSGEMYFEDKMISKMNAHELSVLRNTEIGFIFQMHHLLPQLNLIENILLPTLAFPNINENSSAYALELIKEVGLEDKTYQFPSQLSGGECQRAAVVRALINQPNIILADEPTGSLDQESAEHVGNLLVSIQKKRNIALVVVTHAKELAEKMDTIYRMKDGKLEKSN